MLRKLPKLMLKSDICKSDYQHGPWRYEGHKLGTYGIFCCDLCWTYNWDGWSFDREEILFYYLEKNNLPTPVRNAKGFLPRN